MPQRVRDTDTSSRSILIRRNLDQAAVGVAAIYRAQRTARTLLGHRAFLDCDSAAFEMCDDFVGPGRGEKAQIVAAGGLMVGGEPLHLVGIVRPHIDLLVAE